jgi:hypothetical protein
MVNRERLPRREASFSLVRFVVFGFCLAIGVAVTSGCGGDTDRDGSICASCKGEDDSPCQEQFVTTATRGPVDAYLKSECPEGASAPSCTVCSRGADGVLRCSIPLGCRRAKSPSKANRCYPIDATTKKAIPTVACEDQLPDPDQASDS